MLTHLGLVVALLIGLMAAAKPATAAPQHQNGNTGSIAGKVTLLAPFAGDTMLRLYRLDFPPELAGFPMRSITMQGSGEYVFNGLTPSDAYIVQFTVAGYPDQYYNNQWSKSRANVIRVTAGVTTTHIDFMLDNTGAISGVVTSSATGLPISGLRVRASGSAKAFETTTEANGSYRFSQLPLGNYRLLFEDLAYTPLYQSRTYDQAWVDPFSPDVVTLNDANRTRVVNVILKPTGRLDVHLIAEDGGNPNNLRASIWASCQLHGTGSVITGTTLPIDGVPDGKHRIFINPLPSLGYGLGKTDYYIDKTFVDARAPMTAVNLTLKRGGAIAGSVASESGAGLSGVPVIAYTDDLEASGYDLTDANGSFLMQGLAPGAYAVEVNGDDFATSEYITVAGPTITINTTETITIADIVLRKGSQISGKVSGQNGRLAPYAQIELIDDAGETVARNAVTGDSYALMGIAPGNYRLRFNGVWPIQQWSYELNNNPYIAEFYNSQAMSSAATVINIPSTPITLTNLNATLETGGRIAGAVLDPFSIAMTGIHISVFDMNNVLVSVALTNWDGSYITSPGLPAGQYKVRFDYTACNGRPLATAFYKAAGVVTQDAQSTTGLAAGFDDATPVNVVLGQTTFGINAALVPDGFSITGRVTDKGNAVPDFKLTLNNGAEATTDAGGYYTFTAVYTGTLALAPSTGMSATTPASRNVVVGPNAINQHFSLGTVAATYSIGGRVLRNGIGIAGFILDVSNGAQVTTDASGNFNVANLPAGSYTITPVAGQLPVAPASRTFTLPGDSSADFAGAQVMTPLIVR